MKSNPCTECHKLVYSIRGTKTACGLQKDKDSCTHKRTEREKIRSFKIPKEKPMRDIEESDWCDYTIY